MTEGRMRKTTMVTSTVLELNLDGGCMCCLHFVKVVKQDTFLFTLYFNKKKKFFPKKF